MPSDDYVQSEIDRTMLASTRSPTPPYRSSDYSSEEREEGEEIGRFEPCIHLISLIIMTLPSGQFGLSTVRSYGRPKKERPLTGTAGLLQILLMH